MPGSRKLGRPTDHRKAMLRGMVTFLLENGKIETTVTRAKEVRAMAENMITLGKKNTLASKRQVLSYVTKEDVVKKLFDEIAPKYGYRRMYPGTYAFFHSRGVYYKNDQSVQTVCPRQPSYRVYTQWETL